MLRILQSANETNLSVKYTLTWLNLFYFLWTLHHKRNISIMLTKLFWYALSTNRAERYPSLSTPQLINFLTNNGCC